MCLTEMNIENLRDSRLGRDKQHRLSPLLRPSIYCRLARYVYINDAGRFQIDPGLQHVVSGKALQGDKQTGSTSEARHFEPQILRTEDNVVAMTICSQLFWNGSSGWRYRRQRSD
jgi:hypothetical protein